MKKHKRNLLERAYAHGYKAAITGKSMDICPHNTEAMRFQWTSGWREGRHNRWEGFTGVAGLHKAMVR
jgi:ribosome modulation factor